eukprot:CAMPEP_0119072972 /NCGR_PEP_ID=MMETSP1178-20130426/61275_1 /TAXON_ID=33656 /ORGANISM="unid sp, Strain CCMP2000" /LENGTH=114 /DNA_ID=CAMNT_0007055029 /DNA_START=45 /DNA_END=389 /DNA_ORIENTATION=-
MASAEAYTMKAGPKAELDALTAQHEETGPIPPRPEMKVTREEMKAARIPLEWRDYCAHILIPLNKCRIDHYWLPWTCMDLKHAYEKCQFDEYQRRVSILEAQNKGTFEGDDGPV